MVYEYRQRRFPCTIEFLNDLISCLVKGLRKSDNLCKYCISQHNESYDASLFSTNMFVNIDKVSNIQQNLTCAHQRYSLGLTIRYVKYIKF